MMDQHTVEERARQAGERLYHFHGGLRLRHNKKIACEVPLERVPLPPRLFVPLQQHAPAESVTALVKPGQNVLKGETIGAHGGPAEGYVHAPTSGRVSAIDLGPISHPGGMEGSRVVIEPDGEDRWIDLEPLAGWAQAEPEILSARILKSGLVGLGGAVFPTSHKITGAIASRVHTVILNGAECEPFISCDEMLMREAPQKVIDGAQVVRRAVGAERVIIAIEDQMGVVEQVLSRALEDSGAQDIDIVRVTTIYPEGGERQLIQVLTGLEVPADGYPHDLGLLCLNVATAAAAGDAVIAGQPLIERIVTVSGSGVARPRNLIAPLGTPISHLIEHCGGYQGDVRRLVLGGPMMGYALDSDANPVIKAANCILALTAGDIVAPQPEMPCIRCGECARVCPAMLLPQQLHWQVTNGQWQDASDFGLASCIECGCCDFVCPSHIPLSQWFRYGKGEMRKRAVEKSVADHARMRFEAREDRLERIKSERAERMAQRKRQLKDSADSRQKVAEALERARKARTGEDESK